MSDKNTLLNDITNKIHEIQEQNKVFNEEDLFYNLYFQASFKAIEHQKYLDLCKMSNCETLFKTIYHKTGRDKLESIFVYQYYGFTYLDNKQLENHIMFELKEGNIVRFGELITNEDTSQDILKMKIEALLIYLDNIDDYLNEGYEILNDKLDKQISFNKMLLRLKNNRDLFVGN